MSEKTVAQKLMGKGPEPSGFETAEQLQTSSRETSKQGLLSTEPKGQHDVVQLFVTSRKELEQRLSKVKPLQLKGLVWVTYPKGTSSIKADIRGTALENMLI